VNDTTVSSENEAAVVGVRKYRALYEFVARNQDEISFQPGDIILVSKQYAIKLLLLKRKLIQ